MYDLAQELWYYGMNLAKKLVLHTIDFVELVPVFDALILYPISQRM
jgi:hypothetical protein